MSEHNDELLISGAERLGAMGSAMQPDRPDSFWPTNMALITWHQQQKREVVDVLGTWFTIESRCPQLSPADKGVVKTEVRALEAVL